MYIKGKISLVLLISLILSSCTSYQAQPLSAVTSAANFNQRSLDNPELGQFIQHHFPDSSVSWPLKTWDLASLTLAAFYYHPDLAVARSNNEIANAMLMTAGMRPNPSFSLSPEFTRNVDAGVSPWSVGGSFNLPLETAGKRSYRMAQAKHSSNAAQLQVIQTAWQVRSHVRASLVALYGARQQKAILTEQQKSQTALVELLRQRLLLGEISQVELDQASIGLQQNTLALAEATKQNNMALAQLADAIGISVNALQNVSISFKAVSQAPAPQSLPLKLAQQQALTQRADILAALEDYAASQSALQLEIAKQYPDVTLGPGYTWNQGQNQWSLGLAMDLPVFNRNEGPIAEAKARRNNAAAKFLALQASITGNIEQSIASYRGDYQKITTANANLTLQRRLHDATVSSFKSGESDRLALLESQVALAAAEQMYIDAVVQCQQSLGALEQALEYPVGCHSRFSSYPRMMSYQAGI